MIKIFVNNQPLFVPQNTSALEACESIGISVPRFCYHERLNVAGNCRMCLIEVEKVPKPVAACAFPVAPNMKIYTNTPLVQKARENVLEFLLLNHPLDCPICDQGGECDLQEQTLVFGADRSRFFYSKRSVEDKNCGPLIKTIMTRCIHCTRCVRFFQNIAGQEEFGTTLRGRETEIGTYIGKNLNSELSGNVIDLCPVGALTSKPYAFVARPWEIKSVETIDINDSVGSNIKINFKESEILRVLPTLNDNLNEEWISDKTRFSFDGLKIQRVGNIFIRNNFKNVSNIFKTVKFTSALHSNLRTTMWREALNYFSHELKKYPSNSVVFICGNNLDLETFWVLKKVSRMLNILLISENFSNDNVNLMSETKFNTTFEDILNSDLCLTVGTNPRFEASLLNVRIKKRAKKGNFVKGSVGLCENLTYDNISIGNSLKTLVSIAEGKHPFCKKLLKSKSPFIIIGSGIKKRLDAKFMNFLLIHLSKYTKIVDADWFGINFLPVSSNEVGKNFTGISSKNKLNLSKKKFIYCVGLDSYNSITNSSFENSSFIVTQTSFADSFLKRSNLILPSTAFVEKEGNFLNLEGRVQKTSVALLGPNLARNDDKIITALFNKSLSGYKTPNFSKSGLFLNINDNKKTFTKNLLLRRTFKYSKIFKTPFKAVLSNFFMSNAITQNSLIMAKCAAMFKKNYTNFF